jgi:DNA-binding PadR family transcriptional regulator
MLGYATVSILNALNEGARYGLDIMARTDLPSGTVYPTLGRLEKRGFVKGSWESKAIAEKEGRPRRRYYEVTPAGVRALAESLREFRALADPSSAHASIPQES